MGKIIMPPRTEMAINRHRLDPERESLDTNMPEAMKNKLKRSAIWQTLARHREVQTSHIWENHLGKNKEKDAEKADLR
jgi:hypothetical protein